MQGLHETLVSDTDVPLAWGAKQSLQMSPRLSSAILLRRKKKSRDQVYLVERNPNLRFFGGYHALPGGVVGPDELRATGSDRQEAVWRCALRELFEETGVWAASDSTGLSPNERQELRQALLQSERSGASVPDWEERAARILMSPFRELGWMTTPPFAPVRYETLFLDLELPSTEEASIVPGELVGGRFWEAGEALAAWRRGEIRIVPPVLLILELMEQGSIDDLDRRVEGELAQFAAGKLHPVRFSPGIFMAALRSPTLPPATTTNTLLIGDERIYIVDPGTHEEEEQDRLFDKLHSLEQEGRELAGILLTHSHNDHVGSLRRCAETFGLSVLAHEISLSEVCLDGIDTRELHHGDRIDLGRAPDDREGWQLEVLHTPGHHPGHLCFQEDHYHSLIAGDMISTVSTIVIDPPEGHLATYLDSLEALLARPRGTLYPAHGPALPDSHALLRHYLAHRKDREDALIVALRSGPMTVRQLLPEVYEDVEEALYPIAARSLLAGLQKLEEEGRTVSTDAAWRLTTG